MTVVTGRSACEPSARQLLLQRLAGQRVERAERLVEEEHLRLGRKRARNRDALPHAARQLARPPVDGVAEADLAERVARLARAARSRVRSGNAASTASRTFSSAVNQGSSE